MIFEMCLHQQRSASKHTSTRKSSSLRHRRRRHSSRRPSSSLIEQRLPLRRNTRDIPLHTRRQLCPPRRRPHDGGYEQVVRSEGLVGALLHGFQRGGGAGPSSLLGQAGKHA